MICHVRRMNLLLLLTLGLPVLGGARVVRDRKMGGGGGCGLACYRYNKCRDNSSGSNLSSAARNLRSLSHFMLLYLQSRDTQ